MHATAERLDIELLQHQLSTQTLGRGDRLIYLPTVDSTNSVAMQLAYDRSEEGVVVLTDNQTAGKGRQGRRWVDIAGRNVLSSTILRPLFPPHLLVMISSLAVVDAISDTCDLAASLKWPNDVLIDERKVAGILIETCHDRSGQMVAILGIGVNVNGRREDLPVEPAPGTATHVTASPGDAPAHPTPTTLVKAATTLQTECGTPVSRELFIAQLLRHIEDYYLALQEETTSRSVSASSYGSMSRLIRERWRSHLATLGRAVQVRQGETIITGIAEDVDDGGELLLRCHSGELVSITWGDVGYPTG